MRFRHWVVAAGAALMVQPAFAHHCFAARFDASAPLEVSGKIERTEWVNPHTLIHVIGVNRAGAAGGETKEWIFWAATPNSLLRSGLNKIMLAEGTDVTVRGYEPLDKNCVRRGAAARLVCNADARTVTIAGAVSGQDKLIEVHGSGDGAPGTGECQWSRAAKPN